MPATRPGPAGLFWTCPNCRALLNFENERLSRCPSEGLVFEKRDGIWRFLPENLGGRFRQFSEDYSRVRRAEGRGSDDSRYYRSLPHDDEGAHREEWRIRSVSFWTMIEEALPGPADRSLRIADLGAGNCWMSARLSGLGHRAVAIDVSDDDLDGLSAHVHYDTQFTAVQSDFRRLPFADDQFDVAIWNASFHYSTDYVRDMREALRVLDKGGRIVIVDSPVYTDAHSGDLMVRERLSHFERLYGIRSDSLGSEGFLTHDRLAQLARSLNLSWRFISPSYGWRWSIRSWKARLLQRREPASFYVLVGGRTKE